MQPSEYLCRQELLCKAEENWPFSGRLRFTFTSRHCEAECAMLALRAAGASEGYSVGSTAMAVTLYMDVHVPAADYAKQPQNAHINRTLARSG